VALALFKTALELPVAFMNNTTAGLRRADVFLSLVYVIDSACSVRRSIDIVNCEECEAKCDKH
jgi:hypothetical protein